MLDSALNKGNKPPVIADRIEVVELEMGSQVHPPQQSEHSSPFSNHRSFSPQNWRFEILES